MTVIKEKAIRSDLAIWDGLEPLTSRKDSTGGTIVGLKINWEVDVLQAYGQGLNYTKSTIDKALNALGSKSVTLIFQPGTWVIDGNLTIASNFTVRVPNGVLFEVASGKTLTFSGPVIRDGGTWTSGSGTVTESGTRTFSGTNTFSGTLNLGGTLNFTGSTSVFTALALRGYLGGLTLSNNASDATNDIDISAGMAVDSTNAVMMVLSSSLTKRLDAAWSVGTGNGGLDTGAIANDVYHIWLIRRSDTGVVDALFSASATSPTMPTSYDQKRRIGAIIRASAAILLFTQFGDHFRLTTIVADISVTNYGTSAVSRTLTVPDGVRVKAFINVLLANSATAENLYVSELAASDQAASTSGPVANLRAESGVNTIEQIEVMTNTSAQIRTRSDIGNANTTLKIGTMGWTDYRGKYD